MRILHLPTNIANQAWGMSSQERMMGHQSRVLVYAQLNPNYSADENLHFERHTKIINALRAGRAFAKALFSFDIFHFYFATTFFPNHQDIPLLARFGKKLFFTFQGCDVRTHCFAEKLDAQKHQHPSEKFQIRQTAFLLRYATNAYVTNPDLLNQVPTAIFMPYGSVNYRDWTYRPRPYKQGEEVVIFHAPTDRLVKGSDSVEAAVRQLRRNGYRVRLDLAFGIPWMQVKEKLQHAHLAIDQLMGGWYGAAAVEMMASGKPTICFLREDWMQKTEEPFRAALPLVNSDHTNIYGVLKCLLDRPAAWAEVSQRGRAFVETWHDPQKLAAQLLRDYAGASSEDSSRLDNNHAN